ncbi:MAG: DnaJ domain-containing protein [Alphaproteobacteria bacterium]|nr:MAG: DnaJ domain-containing protein [Alphaproteobacteria bacterium]
MPNMRQRHAYFKAARESLRPAGGAVRACDHPGCAAPAEHRAPKSRDLKDYYWFCTEHARAYNTRWDYFQGMTADAIDAFRCADLLGHRPTWPLGSLGAKRRAAQEDDARRANEKKTATDHLARRLPAAGLSALAVMDLQPPVGFDDIRERYRTLVRRFHPDLRGEDNDSENRLKAVTQAYMVLKALYRPSQDDNE